MAVNSVGKVSPRSVGERLLLAFSRTPGTEDYIPEHVQYTAENALSLLCRVFPDFRAKICGKSILDFGCGTGHQSVALALAHAGRVVGLDTNAAGLEKARQLAEEHGVSAKTEFVNSLTPQMKNSFELVISKDSMEHFPDPESALRGMIEATHARGEIMITFGPPWLAPYGGHMHFFTKLPWVHLVFSEKTVLGVRSNFREDGATHYEEVEGGLNRMTVGKFENLVQLSGMDVSFRGDEYVKNLRWPGQIPGIRELFINQVSCILRRPDPTGQQRNSHR